MQINPSSTPLTGNIRVPGDKSISHRAALLASLAQGKTTITGYAPGSDCQNTLECLRALGVAINGEGSTVTVDGEGLFGLTEPPNVLDLGNSGTTMRLVMGLLAAQPFYSVLTGDDSLRRRPMDRITLPLSKMGASIWGRCGNSLAPLSIRGGALEAIIHCSSVASAQVKSAVLLAGLYAEGETYVEEPGLSRDHTERLLEYFGASIRRGHNHVGVKGLPRLHPRDVEIPGDLSSAAFLLAAAALVPESDLVVEGVGINPTRSGFLNVLNEMGAKIETQHKTTMGREPVADLRIRSGPLRAVSVKGPLIPSVIDEIPIIAVLATQAEGLTLIQDAQELRIKESDRLKAMANALNALGAQVEELPDGLRICGPTPLEGGSVTCSGDHRIAMALAVAALIARKPVRLHGSESVSISYPGFFETLDELGGNTHD